MRILICTNAYPPNFIGGAELVAHALAREWVASGHAVAVLAGDPSGGAARHSITTETYESVEMVRVKLTDDDFAPASYDRDVIDAEFSLLLERFRPDIVHCHNLVGLSFAIPALAVQAGCRVFATLHDYWGFCARNTLLTGSGATCAGPGSCAFCLFGADAQSYARTLEMRQQQINTAFDKVECFVSPSEYLRSQYVNQNLAAERVVVIQNGIDGNISRSATQREKSESLRLLFVGYLGRHKGLHYAIRALALSSPAVSLDIVGEGPERDSLDAAARRQGVSDRVRFRGKFQPRAMAGVYEDVDAVLLPSVWGENQPVCLMEAMTFGLPVIATNIGGIPEMIDDGEQGILVPPGDVVALGRAMNSLLCADLRTTMGNSGRNKIKMQTYTRQAATMMRLFHHKPIV